MKRIDKHVYLTPDQIKRVEEYGGSKGMGFSTSIADIIDRVYQYDILNEKLIKMQNDISFLTRKVIIGYKLLEQLYSDLDFDAISDINKSDALKQFNRLMRRGRLID